MADGSRHSLYFVPEGTGKSNWGVTPNTPAMQTLRNTGVTLGLAKDSLQSEEIRSDRQIADFRLGANQVGGDLNFELSYGTFDSLLRGVLMSDADWADVSGETGVKSIKAGVTRHSFTLMRHFADLTAAEKGHYLYAGVELASMSLTFAANAMVTGSFSVIGKSQTVSGAAPTGSTYPNPTTTSAMDGFTGSIKEGNTNIAVVTECSVTLENGLAARFVVGNKNTIYPEVGRSNCTGSITAYFENSTLVEKFIAETKTSLEIEASDVAGNKYTVVLPNIMYTGGQPDVSGEGSIVLTMPFQALRDPTSGSNIVIKKKNA